MIAANRAAAGLTLSCALLAGACASAPVHYHTLVAPAAHPKGTHTGPAPFVIDVQPVGLPVQLDQQQMVVRNGQGGVVMLEGERWAAPLGDELRAALSVELVQQLDTQDVEGLPRPADRPVLSVRVQVRRLDVWPGTGAELDADWSVQPAAGAGGTVLTCHTQLRTEAPAGYAQLVGAQQRIVRELAGRIATAARDITRPGSACPSGV